MNKANKETLYLSGVISENEYFESQTILSHYRVEDPALASQISTMDGTEVEFDDDEMGATVVIDTITHAKTALMLNKMANEKKIRRVAGPVTRDMTGKAVPANVKYIENVNALDNKNNMATNKNVAPDKNNISGNLQVSQLVKHFPSADVVKLRTAINMVMSGKKLNVQQMGMLGNAFIDLLRANPNETVKIMNLLKKVSAETPGE
jgi:hypothetical protein